VRDRHDDPARAQIQLSRSAGRRNGTFPHTTRAIDRARAILLVLGGGFCTRTCALIAAGAATRWDSYWRKYKMGGCR
jgi:hypothetical protein